HVPLGVVACISPWNFPLAIFIGQVAAALAAGNAVLTKPAGETPLVAGLAVEILIEAGIPEGVLGLLPGGGRVGARLVADPRIDGVLFTGSTNVAKGIQAELARRLGPRGRPIPFVAETGGQNALVVDSSALPEQVVADVLVSAFDSAGQRCSALRVLCLQEEIAERILAMLKGAMAELTIGNPDRLATDIGPVISEAARQRIEAHVVRMRERGHAVDRLSLPASCAAGHFVPPSLIAIDSLDDLSGEVFGPVLHVLRYERDGLDGLAAAINETGYGLTFGVHSRIDATVARLVDRVRAGNLYVNRNLIGAVVGMQPFGGEGLSGTGPKAGGPLYLRRLLASAPAETGLARRLAAMPEPLASLCDALRAAGRERDKVRCESYAERSLLGLDIALPGSVGESNRYSLHPRGTVLCLPASETGLFAQIAACLATGNTIRLQL
ncbi:MAG: L-glutamate gamma-semialdehyde dehydrogenase, partial [Methylobacterium sp.]|uniref:L-glutamate gamma-semialdehyde dehydrogenase n=1 Tax=Methylobacterium sp. TaxID=409 RepID=UPI0027200F13